MGRKPSSTPVTAIGALSRRNISYVARSPCEGCSCGPVEGFAGIGGCGFTLHRANWHPLHPGAINDSHSCRFAPGSIAWGS